jgi:hypothetical protein
MFFLIYLQTMLTDRGFYIQRNYIKFKWALYFCHTVAKHSRFLQRARYTHYTGLYLTVLLIYVGFSLHFYTKIHRTLERQN